MIEAAFIFVGMASRMTFLHIFLCFECFHVYSLRLSICPCVRGEAFGPFFEGGGKTSLWTYCIHIYIYYIYICIQIFVPCHFTFWCILFVWLPGPHMNPYFFVVVITIVWSYDYSFTFYHSYLFFGALFLLLVLPVFSFCSFLIVLYKYVVFTVVTIVVLKTSNI